MREDSQTPNDILAMHAFYLRMKDEPRHVQIAALTWLSTRLAHDAQTKAEGATDGE